MAAEQSSKFGSEDMTTTDRLVTRVQDGRSDWKAKTTSEFLVMLAMYATLN